MSGSARKAWISLPNTEENGPQPLGLELELSEVAEPAALPRRYLPVAGIGALLVVALYFWLTIERAAVLKMLAGSFFPLAVLILAVLGSIVFGLATPTEAAAAGAFGGFVLTALYALARHPHAKRVVVLWAPLLAIVLIVFAAWRSAGTPRNGQSLPHGRRSPRWRSSPIGSSACAPR